MSNPMMRSKPASAAVLTAPTTPPAGPERIESLPRKRWASARPPFDCMKNRRVSASAAATPEM